MSNLISGSHNLTLQNPSLMSLKNDARFLLLVAQEMDLGVLKGPAELLASKVKAFKNCLELATECLTNKDYMNAEMIYGGILADLHKDCFIEALNLNDLELFSLHSCFAYSSIGADYKSEQALVILNSIHKPIKLPLVPYLKAFVHISNDRLSFAHDELQFCQTLLNDGYNFKPNSILNEDIIPEINDKFLKLKINGLRFACELLKAKEDNEDLKKCFKENWLKIGKLCETDFAKLTKKDKKEKEKEKEEEDEPPKEVVEKKMKNKAGQSQTGAIKKTDKQSQPNQISTSEMGIQTMQPKCVHVGVQTMEKEINKQLLTAVLDIKNKMSNMQSKKDNEIKQLQKKNNELSEKLMARDNKRQERSSEFEFLKEQFSTLERKYEQSQKQVEFLQKLLIEQLQQKYHMQKNIYQLFEEKCDYKIVYLCDIQKYLHPSDRPTPEECKQEVAMWKTTLNKVTTAKRDFEVYYRAIDDLIVAKKYSTIKTNDWPGILTIPNDVQDIIYRNFKIIVQQSKSLYSMSFPNNYNAMFGNYGNFRENEHNPNYFVNSYNGYKEDGRTTGSPNYPKFNPPIAMSNGNKQPPVPPQFSFNPQFNPQFNQQYNVQQYRPQQQPVQNKFPEKKFEVPPPSSPTSNNDPLAIYKSDQELLKFLQANCKDVSEVELLQATYQVREISGGSLLGLSKKTLVEEIRKILKKNAGAAKSSWSSVSKVQWQNDHSDNKCCICFEDYDASNSHSLPCQHEFHKKCITNWLKRQSACPVCRVHAVIDEEYPPLKV